MKNKLSNNFGCFVCDDDTLKKFMPSKDYKTYKKIKAASGSLDSKTASSVAKAITKWSLKMGATHYTHWFMPLTGKTAEKQVSFYEFDRKGKVIEELTDKALIKGETDASSFPNGGERETFEARGYTVWDYTSPAFIKEDISGNKTLYIPTAFCSYDGTSLDEKTPLLRATEALNKSCLKILKLLGYNDVKKVNFSAGVEQEYFLVSTKLYNKRADLKMLGRTLLGSEPLKSQEICSHYFGIINDNISELMNEIDRNLWKMGVMAKHQHNEVAPAQYEFVPIYTPTNISCDQNQLAMEVISKIANKYGMTALFEEKPFANINGSGKHANWSISTDTGINLFDQEQPDKELFFTFFVAMISAIDKYNKLIKISASSRGNDLRLGGNEAPPAIISVFASDYVMDMFDYYKKNGSTKTNTTFLKTGVSTLPSPKRDVCDRNRTSPFAFCGNKFEFRMLGSNQSVAFPSTCMCVALSLVLNEMADAASKNANPREEFTKIISKLFDKHKKVVFNGNGYDNSWREEAEKRGLPSFKTSLDAFHALDDKDIVEVFAKTNVLSKNELELRKSNLKNNYKQTVLLEAKTMVEMFNKNIFVSLENFKREMLSSSPVWKETLSKFDKSIKVLLEKVKKLSETITKEISESKLNSTILPLMEDIRTEYDKLEPLIPKAFEPFPTYNDLLY